MLNSTAHSIALAQSRCSDVNCQAKNVTPKISYVMHMFTTALRSCRLDSDLNPESRRHNLNADSDLNPTPVGIPGGSFGIDSIPTFWKFCASNFLFFYRSMTVYLSPFPVFYYPSDFPAYSPSLFH